MKKLITIFLFITVDLYCQDYLNVKHCTYPTYRYALVNDITEITFNSEETEMIINLQGMSPESEDINTVDEITFDESIKGDGTPFPVELAGFTASLNKNVVTLYWTTITEINNLGFEVQRLATPSTFLQQSNQRDAGNWIKICFVEGHGNSNSSNEYSFTDIPVGGSRFEYRLKQIDIDGSFEYSEVISVTIDAPKSFELKQNSPNPFNPTTKIVFNLPVDDFVTIKVYNILGKELASIVNEYKIAGSYTVMFDGTRLSSGIYFCQLASGNNTSLIKMILIK